MLAGVDLDVEERDARRGPGPNGAGKTSLLRLLAGLLPLSRARRRRSGSTWPPATCAAARARRAAGPRGLVLRRPLRARRTSPSPPGPLGRPARRASTRPSSASGSARRRRRCRRAALGRPAAAAWALAWLLRAPPGALAARRARRRRSTTRAARPVRRAGRGGRARRRDRRGQRATTPRSQPRSLTSRASGRRWRAARTGESPTVWRRCSSRARTCASSCAPASCSGRSCRSACSRSFSSRLALGPSARGAAPRRARALLARPSPRDGARHRRSRRRSRRAPGTRATVAAPRTRPRRGLPRQGARARRPAARARRGAPRGAPRAVPCRRRWPRSRPPRLASPRSRPSPRSGTLYGALVAGDRRRRDAAAAARALPALAPVLIAGERAFASSLAGGRSGRGGRSSRWRSSRTSRSGFSCTVPWRSRHEPRATGCSAPWRSPAVALTVCLGLVVTPPDGSRATSSRLLYVHPALAWVALYLAFGTATSPARSTSGRGRARRLGPLAHCAVEVGVVFLALTLVTGSIWGRPAWGVWWTWDARLTSTALLDVLGARLPRAAPRPRRPGDARAPRRGARPARRRSTCPSSTSRCSGGIGCTRARRSSPRTGRFYVHGVDALDPAAELRRVHLVFAWMVRARYQLEVSREAAATVALDAALAERRREGVA